MKFRTRSSRGPLIIAMLMSAMIVLAACNSDDEDDAVDDVAAPAPTEDVTTEDAETPMPVETPIPADETETDDQVTDDATPEEDEADPEMPTPEAPPGEDAAEPTPVPDHDEVDDETGAAPRSVLVYLIRNEEIAAASRDIAGTPEVAAGAINELLTGVTPYEGDLGFSSTVPEGTRLLGLTIEDDSTAVVDLSSEFETGAGTTAVMLSIAQIVLTLTQFDTIDQVDFHIEGEDVDTMTGEGVMVDEPFTRADFEDQSPAILLESPAPGDMVSSPIELRGTSNTFEANMQIEIIDSTGTVIYEDFATATSGSGTRGTFNETIELDIENEGLGSILVYEESAKDGSRTNVVEIPVDFRQ